MNKKAIIFSILLTTLLFTACGSETTPDDANSGKLTEKEAREIILEKVPGATEDDIVEFRKDPDNSKEEYEGEIHYNGMEYEFEMDAYDGTILEWDEEPLHKILR